MVLKSLILRKKICSKSLNIGKSLIFLLDKGELKEKNTFQELIQLNEHFKENGINQQNE